MNSWQSVLGDKIHYREGNSPDYQLRSQSSI